MDEVDQGLSVEGSPVGSDAPEELAAHWMHDCAPLELERLMMYLQ